MLTANVIYFSRTLTRDYRWIYSDNSLHSKDLNNIMQDYEQFEQDPYNYGKNSLVVRSTERGLALYTFEVTDREDAFSRKALAIKGLSFSDFDGTVAEKIREYVATFLLFELLPNGILDVEVDDFLTNAKKSIVISVDECLEYCRNSEGTHAFLESMNEFMLCNQATKAVLVNDSGVYKMLVDSMKSEALQQGVDAKNTSEEICESAYPGGCQPIQVSPVKINTDVQGRKSLLGRIKSKINNI